MAILGYNTKGAVGGALSAGVKIVSKFTLASAGTLNELHGWFGGSANSVILCIYDDVAGVPTNRLAYTSPLALTGVDVDLSQTGFSVALPAGDYWIGFTCGASTGGTAYRENSGGTHATFASGAAYNPPSDPFGGGYTTGARKYSMWAVTGAPGPPPSTFVPQVAIL